MASRHPPAGGVWQFDAHLSPRHAHSPRAADGGAGKPAAAAAGVQRLRRSRFRFEPRFQVVAACFLATLTMYVERVGFSIAYTAMAKEAAVSETTKGTVLSAFYWGYGISQVPGGWAAQLYGGDKMLSISFFFWSLASLLTPGSAANTRAIILARICVGVSQGFLIPAVHTVLSVWIPPTERARCVSLTTSGMYLGSAVAMQVLPAVSAVWGPASLLRVVGGMGLAWLLMWRILMRQMGRRTHAAPLPGHAAQPGAAGGPKGKPAATPWRRMMLHPAVWAIVVNNFTFHYAFYVVMNWLPTYFDKVLHANLASMGLVKTLPYLVMFASSNAGGWAGDYLINVRRMAVAGGRKWVNTLGFWGAAAALMLMPGARTMASGVLFTTLALGMCGFARGGFSVNHMDIAPRFAGVVMGISNTAGTLSGVIGVAVTGHMLERAGGADRTLGWYQAMATSAIQCVGGSFIFLFFARGERLFGGDTAEFQ